MDVSAKLDTLPHYSTSGNYDRGRLCEVRYTTSILPNITKEDDEIKFVRPLENYLIDGLSQHTTYNAYYSAYVIKLSC